MCYAVQPGELQHVTTAVQDWPGHRTQDTVPHPGRGHHHRPAPQWMYTLYSAVHVCSVLKVVGHECHVLCFPCSAVAVQCTSRGPQPAAPQTALCRTNTLLEAVVEVWGQGQRVPHGLYHFGPAYSTSWAPGEHAGAHGRRCAALMPILAEIYLLNCWHAVLFKTGPIS